MEVVRKNFFIPIPDNDEIVLSMLVSSLESSDELASLQITKSKDHYSFRINPSMPKYNNIIIEELLQLANTLGIKLSFGKSIKSSCVLVFDINLS